MTYIAGLGSAEPSVIKNANLHPYFTTCKTPPITPFFAKMRGHYGPPKQCTFLGIGANVTIVITESIIVKFGLRLPLLYTMTLT